MQEQRMWNSASFLDLLIYLELGEKSEGDWGETVQEEAVVPDKVFRIHLPNEAGFAAAVKDQESRERFGERNQWGRMKPIVL